jgi:hypothetical protein
MPRERPINDARKVSSLRDVADYIADNANRIPVSYAGKVQFLNELPADAALLFMAEQVRAGKIPHVSEVSNAAA